MRLLLIFLPFTGISSTLTPTLTFFCCWTSSTTTDCDYSLQYLYSLIENEAGKLLNCDLCSSTLRPFINHETYAATNKIACFLYSANKINTDPPSRTNSHPLISTMWRALLCTCYESLLLLLPNSPSFISFCNNNSRRSSSTGNNPQSLNFPTPLPSRRNAKLCAPKLNYFPFFFHDIQQQPSASILFNFIDFSVG